MWFDSLDSQQELPGGQTFEKAIVLVQVNMASNMAAVVLCLH